MPYVPKTYFDIDLKDLEFINSCLDWEIERAIGPYFKASSQHPTGLQ